MKKLVLSAAVMLCGVGVFAADGIKIVSNTKDLASGSLSSTNLFLTDNNVVLENKGSRDNMTVIFDASKEEFTYVDHNKREYYFFDKAGMEKLKQQVKMMMMMMQQFAANMPEEQKKKLEKVMNKDASQMKFNETGSSAKVGKWNAKVYEGISNQEKATEMYIASFSNIGFSKEKFQVMEKLFQYINSNLSDVAAFLPTGGSFSQFGFDDSSPVFKEGVPVKTISYKANQPTNENVVQSIEKTNISESMFKAPSGYARKQIQMK